MVIEFADRIFRPLGQEGADAFDDTRRWLDPRGHRLSDRVWLGRQATRDAIDRRLREAIANGDDPLLVADDLERYLNPALSPVRDARGNLVPGQRRGIVSTGPRPKSGSVSGLDGAGSYPARRLARTEISRAFAAASDQADRLNPFVDRARYSTSGSHDETDECDDREQRSSRGEERGVYTLDEFPRLPTHPQCMCYRSPVVTRNTDDVVAQLRRDFGLDPIYAADVPDRQQRRSLIATLFRAFRASAQREAA